MRQFQDKPINKPIIEKQQKLAGDTGKKAGLQFLDGLIKIAQERVDNSLESRIKRDLEEQ
ncbi:hypothetical protein J7904_06595 [Vibrio parahaemolyticus]|nr:hypothetical protein [Vibrio parahaemolyticus]MCF9546950.1 hypothetical protein [Vibrio parahaemolyticus]